MVQPEQTGQARRKADQPHEEQSHASVGFYWMIGGILAAVTGMEVAIFYIPGLGGAMGPLLIALSAGKFLLVVMFFMHLKFDSKVFTALFVVGLSVAIFMVSALVVLYHYLPRFRV
jgi:cytochrome c oxidase subunit IV